ncbi:MAG: SAM-dependent methyltransferase [Bacteroidia bacterium]
MSRHPSSFRDPSGFIFTQGSRLLRQINAVAKTDYDLMMSSGLYDYLVKKELLVAHKEVENIHSDAYKTLEPDHIPFISYPYEWSFDQLKDAALLTLRIQKIALKHGMTLKDSSAYNVQFCKGKPIFIDSLSFEKYKEGKPWDAYKQFCQHFLAPLALASYKDIRLNKLMQTFIDGVPLDLASTLLPSRTKLKFSFLSHIHWHAKTQVKHADKAKDQKKIAKVSQTGLLGIISNLKGTIEKLSWNSGDTEWGDYYNNTNYSEGSFEQKMIIIQEYLNTLEAKSLWDLGANDGTFSMIAANLGIETLACDIDPIAVNKNYLKVKNEGITNMHPLLMDLTNPSPDLGWAHTERDSLQSRGPADCIMALALVHHLAISNNLPMELIATYFGKLGKHLIIEFVPKGDSKVDTLLSTRDDIFPNYTYEGFEKAFSSVFDLMEKRSIDGSDRTLYLYKTRS